VRKYAKVVSQEPVGAGVFLLRLEAPAVAAATSPGTFVMLRVSGGPEPLLARPFSVHGAEGDHLLILYQVVGRGTEMLSRVEPGRELACWGPLGNGFNLDCQRPLLVAGGMGVAPLWFAARAMAERGAEVSVLFGLAGAGGYSELLAVLQDQAEAGKISLSFTTEDGSLGEKGLVTHLMPQALERADRVLACGPPAMLKAVASLAAEAEVACQVSLEAPMACGVGACLGCVVPAVPGGGYLRVCQEGPVLGAARVDWERL